MTGLHVRDFAQLVVRPVLKGMAEVTERKGLYSKAAERLVLGTCIQESRLRHLRQRARVDGRRGPALGLPQIEPDTHRDVWINYVRFRPEIDHFLRSIVPFHEGTIQVVQLSNEAALLADGIDATPDIIRAGYPIDSALVWNLAYAVAVCRLVYYRIPVPLPAANDLDALGEYWKLYYNTLAGAGEAEEFVKAYEESTPAHVFADSTRNAWRARRVRDTLSRDLARPR